MKIMQIVQHGAVYEIKLHLIKFILNYPTEFNNHN